MFKIIKNLLPLILAGSTLVSSANATTHTDVYIASAKEGIFTSQLNLETGALTPPKQVANIAHSGFLTLHPNKKFIYATGDAEKKVGGVIAFSINSDASLTEISRQSAQGKRLCHISLDATSQMLMGANYGDGNVVSFPLKSDGSLGKLISLEQHSGSSINKNRQTGPHAHSIYAGPDNQFAYAPDLGIDKIMIYRIDPTTAKLTPSGFAASPAGAGPRHMKFGKDGKQAYVLNELDSSISIFTRQPAGSLIARKVVSTLPDNTDKTNMACSEIRVLPDGKYIYCANRDLSQQKRDSLSVFKVGKNGTLTRIQTIGAEVSIPRNINLDPSGQWLLVAGQKSNNVPVFQIDSTTGKLTYTKHQIKVPTAMCIEFKK